MNINNWCRKNPQPFAILALVDGQEKRIELSGGGRQWRDLAKTVESLNPTKITAVDRAGNVLRCLDIETEDPDDKEAAPVESETSAEIKVFAKLIAEAYQVGGKSYEPLLKASMEFIASQSSRLASQEREIERLRTAIHKLNGQLLEMSIEPAAEEPSVAEQLFAGLAAGQAAQHQHPAVRAVKSPKTEGVK